MDPGASTTTRQLENGLIPNHFHGHALRRITMEGTGYPYMKDIAMMVQTCILIISIRCRMACWEMLCLLTVQSSRNHMSHPDV